MQKVKVADHLQYDIGQLQRGLQVSPDIPKVIITPSEEVDEE
jgi:hypothetical protein